MPTILITGANRGLGFEFVRQYAADGWDVIATCRQPAKADKLQALAKQSGTIKIEMLDATDAASIAKLAAGIKDAKLDVLINNAGVISGNPQAASVANDDTTQDFGTIDAAAWMKVLQANTIAPIMVTQALLPVMAAKGKIINITSKMGAIGEMGSGYIAYRSSKAALNAAMVTISHNIREQGMTIANLHPGWVQTDMGGSGATLTPEVSITGMRKVIAGLTPKDTGRFLSYDGTTIEW